MEKEELNTLGSVSVDWLKSEESTGMIKNMVGHDFQEGKIYLPSLDIKPFYTRYL